MQALYVTLFGAMILATLTVFQGDYTARNDAAISETRANQFVIYREIVNKAALATPSVTSFADSDLPLPPNWKAMTTFSNRIDSSICYIWANLGDAHQKALLKLNGSLAIGKKTKGFFVGPDKKKTIALPSWIPEGATVSAISVQ